MSKPKYKSFVQIKPKDTEHIATLIRQGRREQAYAEFYKLLLQCKELLDTEPYLLARQIYQQARAA